MGVNKQLPSFQYNCSVSLSLVEKDTEMTSCQCEGIEAQFDEENAESDLDDYRKDGPSKVTKVLIDTINHLGVEGLTLLDIGGGVGSIQHELIRAGVEKVASVDASSAYLAAGKKEAERQGHAEKINFKHGNFVDIGPKLNPADIVTLDKVICCYDEMQTLVNASLKLAKKIYGVIFPIDFWLFKVGVNVLNFFGRLFHNPFQIFAHPTVEIEKIIKSNGFKRNFYKRMGIWQVILYTK